MPKAKPSFRIPPDKLKFKQPVTTIWFHERLKRIRKYNTLKKRDGQVFPEKNVEVDQFMISHEYLAKMIDYVHSETLKQKTQAEKENILQPVDRMEFDSNMYFKDPSYYPFSECSIKLQRFLLAKDISAGGTAVPRNISIYCDIPVESNDLVFTHVFDYIDQSTYVLNLQQKTDFRKHTVSCACMGQCVPETCACMKLNQDSFGNSVKFVNPGRLMEVFEDGKDPVQGRADHHERYIVMCGDQCGCGEKCGNHIRQMAREDHAFEIFRRSKEVGFGVRVLTPVYLGDVICEVTGVAAPAQEIRGRYNMQRYAYTLYNSRTTAALNHLYKAAGHRNVPQNCRPEKDEEWFIETYYQGNISRFVNHGCLHNVAPIRVIANYLHPAFHRLYLVAVAPIALGAELMMDYKKTIHLPPKHCACATDLCPNNKLTKEFCDSMTAEEFRNALLGFYDKLSQALVNIEKNYKEGTTSLDEQSVESELNDISVLKEDILTKRENARCLKIGELQMQIRMFRCVADNLHNKAVCKYTIRQMKREYNRYEQEIKKCLDSILILEAYYVKFF